MGRKALPKGDLVADVVDKTAIEGLSEGADQLAALHAQNDEVLAMGMDLGRLEALDFVATIANSAKLSIYENVKKSKAWRNLRNEKNCDGRNFLTFEEFCEVKLGASYRRLQELASNRNTIGQEAFEQAERIGLRQVDFNAIKALPAGEQAMISQALRTEATKDEVLNTLQELAARHSKEKADLSKRLEESEAERQAGEQVREDLSKKLTTLQVQTRKKVAADTDWPDALQPLGEQVAAARRKLATAMSELETCRITAFAVGGEIPEEDGAQRAKFESALGHIAEVYAEALQGAEKAVAAEMNMFNSTLANFLAE